MKRDLYTEDHEAFRATVKGFIERHILPNYADWEAAGVVDRSVWLEGGKQGLLGTDVDEKYGGGGIHDFRYNAIIRGEITYALANGVGFGLHNDVVAPYLIRLGTDDQKERWFPGFCSGERITAIAMSEPAAGSDLQGMQSTAVRDGDAWILNGQKTFITNGYNADLIVVAAKTGGGRSGKGLTLFGVERGMPGFERGRLLQKIGMKAQDTAELFFTDVRVPSANVIGEVDSGFVHLMENLPQERLAIAVAAVRACDRAFDETLEYAKTRTAFNAPIGSFQNSRFRLAELATEIQIAHVFVDKCVEELNAGRLNVTDAAMAKWWTTELQKRVVDVGVQLHGGYGYMLEYPIAKAYLDARVQTVYGGTTEIMKEIIGRSLGV